jgi:HlyD family secretion protein
MFGLTTMTAATAAGAWFVPALARGRQPTQPERSLEWVFVERDDLQTTLVAGGDLQAAKQTTVTCQVEDITDSDGTAILTVIPNGSVVKKGDELCRLDASAIEELTRLEEIQVSQAQASWQQAKLTAETAKIALREYQEGLVKQSTQEFQSKIALGRSDAQRQADRVAWAEAMEIKGYLSKSQLLSERQWLARIQHELRTTEGQFDLFRRFEVPREIQTLRGQIEMAETNSRVEADRLKAEQGQLAYYREQIKNCIMRAPHDGVVVHANGGRLWRRSQLEPGLRVYQDQVMFKLPDLSQMDVEVSVHEYVGPRVRVGMKANVELTLLGNQVIPGRVVSIEMLSVVHVREDDERVRNFIVRVRLDKTPPSALPFMSASVEFDTGRVNDALVIPVEAVAVDHGRESCYVIADHGLEKRPITTRRANRNFLEVTGGLNEGERVIFRSSDAEGLPARVIADDRPGSIVSEQDRTTVIPESISRAVPEPS